MNELEKAEIEHLKTLQEDSGLKAIYKSVEGWKFPIVVIPTKPAPGRIAFGDHQLYDTQRVFILDKRKFFKRNRGINPSEGDRIFVRFGVEDREFVVDSGNGYPTWLDSGNYGVMMRVCAKQYRKND